MKRNSKFTLLLGALMAMFVATPAQATVTFYFDTLTDPPAGIPSGTAPWATLTIDNSGANTVTMSLTHVGDADPGQFFATLLLNIAGYAGEAITVTGTGPNGAVVEGYSFGSNSQNPGGYDLKINFDIAPPSDRFSPGMTVSWTVSMAGLDENDFVDFSANSGRLAQLHIQGLANGGSQWVTPVPEPASMAALGIGALALLRRRRK